MKRRVLVIMGHPDKESFCSSLADACAEGAASAGHAVDLMRLCDLSFDPVLHKGYKSPQPLEPDLEGAQRRIAACEHLVVVFPTWWGTYPALLKGFVDRVFLPGFAYKYDRILKVPRKLLSGRSARLIVTLDSPATYYNHRIGAPGVKSMERSILGFCGFSPVETTLIPMVRFQTSGQRGKWLAEAAKLGAKAE